MPEYPKITSKKIPYKNAPSGMVIIGKYVPPFEDNDTGFGFKGVVIEDIKTNQLECCICGKWFENLPTHLRGHGITAPDYKRRFGLLQSTALKSHRLRVRQSEVMSGMRKKHKKHRIKFQKNNQWAGNRKGIKKAEESKNKYGVCDLQIMDKVMELTKEMGKTPTLIDLQKRYGQGFIFHLYKRYGSYVKYCIEAGLIPNFSNNYPKYSREYFIEKALSNEASTRIFTQSEKRNLYKYIHGGIPELKKIVMEARK